MFLPDSDVPKYLQSIAVVETELISQGIDALIGRDILQHCVLIYNGGLGFYTLAF